MTKKQYIFRFLGSIPIGRFEYSCKCGYYNLMDGLESIKEGESKFICKRCGTEIRLWQQPKHWHMEIDENHE